MRINFIGLLGLLFIVQLGFGQKYHHCAFEDAIAHRAQQDVDYRRKVQRVFDEAQRIGTYNGARNIYTIPVAVHVVWTTGNLDQRLSEVKVVEQINVLNEDYRRLNEDTINTRSIFAGVAADTRIQFRLDTIIWKETAFDFGSCSGLFGPDIDCLDDLKAGTNGSATLDPSSYLNIWIANLGSGGLLGYAYPPDSLSNWPAGATAPTRLEQGVVLHHEIVGRSGGVTISGFGTSQTIITQGRTATHEVGHYLGLRHIWGDGGNIFFPATSCADGEDGIQDTPNCISKSDFDCDTTKNQCVDTINVNGIDKDLPDMVENYMDYSAESCMNSFTKGQGTLMRGVLASQRADLALTTNPNRPDNDFILNAAPLAVSTTVCASTSAPYTTSNATVSIDTLACGGAKARDVWFSFNAVASDVNIYIDNITGTGNVVYEVLDSSFTTVTCDSTASGTLSGLTVGEGYYLRVYSVGPTTAINSFDVCLTTVALSTESIQRIMQQGLNVYPNPAANLVTVELEAPINFEGTIVVRNLLGQAVSSVLEISSVEQRIQLNLGTLPNGIYVVEAAINGVLTSKKLMLQR